MGVSRRDDHDDEEQGPRLVDSDAETMRDLERLVAATPQLKAVDRERILERAALGVKLSQERMVAANLGLVIEVAYDHEAQCLSLPDLVGRGSIGLAYAVRTYA